MKSSAMMFFRAFSMLACVVGITVAATAGTSWSDIVQKFRNFDWPFALPPASASTHGGTVETDRVASPGPIVKQRMAVSAQTGGRKNGVALEKTAAVVPKMPPTSEDIQLRLQKLGATYYLLETWGSDRQLYRFSCKMAVGGNSDYTRCFEAVAAESLQAMSQVLSQVESWRRE